LDFTGFRVGFCGGDKISPDSLRLFNDLIARNGGSGRVLDGYGLSEVCPVTVMPRNGDGPTGSIGVPIPGVHLSIVEPGTTTTLPRNSEGEICVSGDALMSGYLDDEEATRKVLWRHDDGRTWLHTGDSGYMDESGYLFFKSRLRQIIKVSGNTVYLTEVQSVLSRHPAVARVAAVPKTDEKGQERVGVVIVPAGELTRQEVLAHCQELLPPWAVPVSIEFRDELPVNLLGKIAWGKL
jgi:long-chain acyl-CoA synthetase